jgi:hypothetical protein
MLEANFLQEIATLPEILRIFLQVVIGLFQQSCFVLGLNDFLQMTRW